MVVERKGIESEIFDAQIRAIYEHTPIVLTANVVNAGLVALVLGVYAGDRRWWAFLALIVVLSGARAVLWSRNRSLAPRGPSTRAWAIAATVGSGLSGIIWGAGPALLLPFSIVDQTFLAFVIGGMAAGALVTLSYHLPVFVAFVMPATLPLAVRFLLDGRPVYIAMASMIILFSASLAVASRNFGRSFAKSTRLRYELQERSEQLAIANRQLENEIADRRTTEDRLHQAQKMDAIGQLTGGIAHDFNNLLTAVIGQLELAQRRAGGDDRLMALLHGAYIAAERGATLTQRLLAFARRQRLDTRAVDVAVIIGEIEKLLKQTIGPSIRLLTAADAELWPARVDPHQLELAILNLALNARDAMPTGGTLLINAERRYAEPGGTPELAPGAYVVISVSDTGTGMDAETLARVFEPFFTTKEVGRGSGLGLPMVHGFAVQSGGGVHVESTPGKGTKAELWLPRATEDSIESDQAEPVETAAAAARARIVVCDDDPGVRSFVGDVLRESGHAVWEADRPTTALKVLETERAIDLLLVDYAMPEMNGAALIERAHNLRPGLRLLMMSGDAGALQSGGVAGVRLLQKPFKIAELQEGVASVLAGPPPAAIDARAAGAR